MDAQPRVVLIMFQNLRLSQPHRSYKICLLTRIILNGTCKQRTALLIFMPWHRKYSQSEYKKALVYTTVSYPTFPSCAVRMSHYLCCSLYFLWHGIKQLYNPLSWNAMEIKVRVYTEKIQVTCEIFHGIPRENIA